jgi:hypothetical protein
MPPKKFAHAVGEDLKAVKDMVPQLKTEGFHRWYKAMLEVGDLLEWSAELLDLTTAYSMNGEDEAKKANRMVAWLLLKKSIDGHEDLIEMQLQSGDCNFNSAFKCIHSEFNRATTAHVNQLLSELITLTMTQSQTGVRQFAALIVRQANKLKEMGGGDISEAQRLAIFMNGLPSPEYEPAKRQLRFSKVNNLAQAVADTRDFAIAENLENEAGMETAPRKKQHMFNTEAKVEACRNFAKTGKCRFGDKCHFSHSTNGQQPNVKKFGGTCYNCGKTGHRKHECKGKKDQEGASNDDDHYHKKHQDHRGKGDGSQQKKHHEKNRRGANETNLHFMGGASDEDDEDSYDMQKNEMFKEKQDRCFMFKDNNNKRETERHRERQRETERDRERERERQRERDRERQRQKERSKERDKERDRETRQLLRQPP